MSTLVSCAESERVKAEVCEVERVDDDGDQGEDIEQKSEAVVDGIPGMRSYDHTVNFLVYYLVDRVLPDLSWSRTKCILLFHSTSLHSGSPFFSLAQI